MLKETASAEESLAALPHPVASGVAQMAAAIQAMRQQASLTASHAARIAQRMTLLAAEQEIPGRQTREKAGILAEGTTALKTLAQDLARAVEEAHRRVESIRSDTEASLKGLRKTVGILNRILQLQAAMPHSLADQSLTASGDQASASSTTMPPEPTPPLPATPEEDLARLAAALENALAQCQTATQTDRALGENELGCQAFSA
jgi:hypothetical protein